MSLTDYFIKRKVKRLASVSAKRKHAFCPLDEAKSILVLYQECDHAQVEAGLEKLRKLHKQVQVCVYADRMNADMADAYTVIQAKKDVDAWRMPSKSLVERVKAIRADIVIDLTPADCYPMQYIMLQHPCRFKVGVKHTEADLYDLAISVEKQEDLGQLFGHILFYLQAIRSK